MGSSDNFCLRWNDFESNISTSFRELREDSEFFDVSLCCDNGTDVVPAHKVILAACSPLFRKILSRQKNQQNPFLYLKGIHLKELQAVLNFMYHGEVNVAQDSLNNFLAVAEELAVKGLTTDSKPGSEPISTPSGSSKKAVPPKRKPPQTPSGSTHPSPSTSAKKPKISQADDVVDIDPHDVDIKSIKAEPEPSGSGGGVGASGAVAHGGPDPDLGDDSYAGDQDDNGDFGAGEDFEGFEQYGDGAEFDDSMAGAAAAGGSGAAADGKGSQGTTKMVIDFYRKNYGDGLLYCLACGFSDKVSTNMRYHVERHHYSPGYTCNFCGKRINEYKSLMNHHNKCRMNPDAKQSAGPSRLPIPGFFPPESSALVPKVQMALDSNSAQQSRPELCTQNIFERNDEN